MKRVGGLVPAWRNIPKSHSSSILEVESSSSASGWMNSIHFIGNGKIPFLNPEIIRMLQYKLSN